MIIIIMIIITKSSYNLERERKVRAFTVDTTNIIIMRNMGERKHINTKEANKNKDGEKYSKNIITKYYITRGYKD
jgi:hypothetical protein